MLKITVLVENNTYIDSYYLGEPALSYFIECDGLKVLFDVGYSDAFIQNAKKMNIDLNNLDYLVLSHGHNDHVGGLRYLIDDYDLSNTTLVSHPDTFIGKYDNGLYIGPDIFVDELKNHFRDIVLTKEVFNLNSKLLFLGEVERSNDYEAKHPVGYRIVEDEKVDDYVIEDSALVYCDNHLDIITACSHSGICNICEYAKKVTGINKINMIIGGFHLFENDEVLAKTINYLKECDIDNLYPCHCVSLMCKHEMMNSLDINEVGVGLVIQD